MCYILDSILNCVLIFKRECIALYISGGDTVYVNEYY